MTQEERKKLILELKSKRTIQLEEIKLSQLLLESISMQLFEAEWVKITWEELEAWLKENRPENNYEKNPAIKSGYNSHTSFCKLTIKDKYNNEGELQIGAYYNNDQFPRGKDLYIPYDFRSYRD